MIAMLCLVHGQISKGTETSQKGYLMVTETQTPETVAKDTQQDEETTLNNETQNPETEKQDTITTLTEEVTKAQSEMDAAATAFEEAQASGETSAIIDAAVEHRKAQNTLAAVQKKLSAAQKEVAVEALSGLKDEIVEAIVGIVGDKAESVHVVFGDEGAEVYFNRTMHKARKANTGNSGNKGVRGKYATAMVTVIVGDADPVTMSSKEAMEEFASEETKAKFSRGRSYYKNVPSLLSQQDNLKVDWA